MYLSYVGDGKVRSLSIHALMPTIYLRPRRRAFPYFYRVAERMAMRKLSSVSIMLGIWDLLLKFRRNARRNLRAAELLLPLMAIVSATMLHEEI